MKKLLAPALSAAVLLSGCAGSPERIYVTEISDSMSRSELGRLSISCADTLLNPTNDDRVILKTSPPMPPENKSAIELSNVSPKGRVTHYMRFLLNKEEFLSQATPNHDSLVSLLESGSADLVSWKNDSPGNESSGSMVRKGDLWVFRSTNPDLASAKSTMCR